MKKTRKHLCKYKYRKSYKRGGSSGIIKRILNMDNNSPIIGAGSYGIVIQGHNKEHAIKLFYDMKGCNDIKREALIQLRAKDILHKYLPEVHVPNIYYYENNDIIYRKEKYLCGIIMELLPFPKNYNETVHCVLGYYSDDINKSWGRITSLPVDDANPSRGFFADANHLEDIWEEEGSTMTIEHLAYLMGRTSRILVDNGIMPIDVEYIWSKGQLCIIDFGLCKEKYIDPIDYLNMKGVDGLMNDVYIPHKDDEGYDSFMKGYLS